MSDLPPRRSDTRSSLRDVREGIRGARKALHNDFTNLKRRMSSNITAKTHTSGPSTSPGPGPGKRAKMMVSKTVDKLRRRSSSPHPRSFEPRIGANETRPTSTDYHHQQQQPYPQLQLQQQQQDRLDSQSMLDVQGVFTGYYETNATSQQYNPQSHPLSDPSWSTPMMLDTSAAITMPSASVMQTHSTTVPCINTNMDLYPSENWQDRTATSRAHILGSPPITPPPHHAFVEGPIHDLNQLDRSSTLRGTHRARYTRTVSTVNDLSAAVTSSGSPTNTQETSLPASPETPVSGGRKASLPCRNGSNSSTADGKKPCPWPGCEGTRDTNVFESNRLKEHLRRKHLWPYMCDTCDMRKGDKHQIKRHREHKHPQEDPKLYKDQTNDGLAAKQLKMLSERAISYERIVRICQAKSVEELDEPWGSDVRTYQSLAVRPEAISVPVSPTSGLAPHPNMYTYAGPSAPPSITFADTIPSVYPSGPDLLPSDRIPGYGPRLNTTDPIMDFVTNFLVPHIENLNVNSSPSPSRASRDEHLQRVLDLIAASAKQELDQQERRRSSGATSNAPSYGLSYTDMVTSGAQISASAAAGGGTPSLTNDKSLTARSSYGSLNPPPLGGALGGAFHPLFLGSSDNSQKQWTNLAAQQQQTMVQQPNPNAFGGSDQDQEWMDEFLSSRSSA